MTYLYDLRPMPCTKSCVYDHCTRGHALILTTAQDAMYILIIMFKPADTQVLRRCCTSSCF